MGTWIISVFVIINSAAMGKVFSSKQVKQPYVENRRGATGIGKWSRSVLTGWEISLSWALPGRTLEHTVLGAWGNCSGDELLIHNSAQSCLIHRPPSTSVSEPRRAEKGLSSHSWHHSWQNLKQPFFLNDRWVKLSFSKGAYSIWVTSRRDSLVFLTTRPWCSFLTSEPCLDVDSPIDALEGCQGKGNGRRYPVPSQRWPAITQLPLTPCAPRSATQTVSPHLGSCYMVAMSPLHQAATQLFPEQGSV